MPTEDTPETFVDKVIGEVHGRAAKYLNQGISRADAYEAAHTDMMSEVSQELDIRKARLTSTVLQFQGREQSILKRYREGKNPADSNKRLTRALWELIDPSRRFSHNEGNNLVAVLRTATNAASGTLRNIFHNYKSETGKDPFKVDGGDLNNAILYARQERFSKGKQEIEGDLANKPTDKDIAKLGRAIEEHQQQLFETQKKHGNPISQLSSYIHGNIWNKKILMRRGRPGVLEKNLKTPTSQIKGLSVEGTHYFYSAQGQKLAKMAVDYSNNTNKDWEDFFGEEKVGTKSQARSFIFWLSDMQKLANQDTTFKDIETHDEDGNLTTEMVHTWYGAFRNLTKGDLLQAKDADTALFGQASVKRRYIHFKTPAMTAEATQRWGATNTPEAIERGISRLGHQIGMLKWGGGAIHQGFKDLLSSLESKIGDVHTTKNLSKAQRLFNITTGNLPSEETVASTITQGTMTLFNFAKLGLVTPSSLPDSATTTTALMYHGERNTLDLLRNHVIASLSSYGPEIEKDYAHLFDLLGVGADFMRSSMALSARAGETFSLGGVWSRANYKFFQWNLLHHHDTQLWRQVIAVATRNHAIYSKTLFKDLPGYMQREFGRFNIGTKEWNFYRKFLTQDNSGRHYLDFSQFNPGVDPKPALLKDALAQYNPALKSGAQEYYAQSELYDRYTQMLDDLQRQAVVIPTAGTRYWLHGAGFGKTAARGSPLSAVFSLISQFKNFPLQLTRTAMSGVYHAAKDHHDYAPAINYLTSQFIYNYLAWGAKSMLNFKSWPSFSQMKDNNQRYQSFLQNVFLPSLGVADIVFGNEIQESKSLLGSFMGPTGQFAQTLGTDLVNVVHGKVSRNELIKPLLDLAPTTLFVLGPVIKNILDNLKTHQALRSQTRYMRNEGQHYLFRSNP